MGVPVLVIGAYDESESYSKSEIDKIREEYIYVFFEPIERPQESSKVFKASVRIEGGDISIRINDSECKDKIENIEGITESLAIETYAYQKESKIFLAVKGKLLYLIRLNIGEGISVDKSLAVRIKVDKVEAEGFEVLRIKGRYYRPRVYRLYTKELVTMLSGLVDSISRLVKLSKLEVEVSSWRKYGWYYYGPRFRVYYNTIGKSSIKIELGPSIVEGVPFKLDIQKAVGYIILAEKYEPDGSFKPIHELSKEVPRDIDNIFVKEYSIDTNRDSGIIIRNVKYDELVFGKRELISERDKYAPIIILYALLTVSLIIKLHDVLARYRDTIDNYYESLIFYEYVSILKSIIGFMRPILWSKLPKNTLVVAFGSILVKSLLNISLSGSSISYSYDDITSGGIKGTYTLLLDFHGSRLEEDTERLASIEREKTMRRLERIVTVFLAPIAFTELALSFRDAASDSLIPSESLLSALMILSVTFFGLSLFVLWRIVSVKVFLLISALELLALILSKYFYNRSPEASLVILSALLLTELGITIIFWPSKDKEQAIYLSGVEVTKIRDIVEIEVDDKRISSRNYLIIEGVSKISGTYEGVVLVTYTEGTKRNPKTIKKIGLARIEPVKYNTNEQNHEHIKYRVVIRSKLEEKYVSS